MRASIASAQTTLEKLTGQAPVSIVYPFGRYNERVLDVTRQLGLELGFIVQAGSLKLPLPVEPRALLQLPRVPIVPEYDIHSQCELARLDWRPFDRVRNWCRRVSHSSQASLWAYAAQESWWTEYSVM